MRTKLLESENEEAGLRRRVQCRVIVSSEYENEQDVYNAASQEASI